MNVTFFPNEQAFTLQQQDMTLEELRTLILETTARTKDELPWLKLATFGDERTDKNCLRHNKNVVEITGIELDYDDKKMPFEDAVALIKKAQLHALLFTSASYKAEEPKWRIVMPTSRTLPPPEREKLVARVNGLFDGAFADESFVLSQAYYYGSVNDNPEHRAVITEGRFIDERGDLDAGARGKMNGAAWDCKPRTPGENPEADPDLIYLAMSVIPNDDVSREQWNNTGMAIWRATSGHPRGLEAFTMWSQKSKKCRSKSRRGGFMERWNHYFDSPPTVIGAGSIINLANKASPGWDREYWREYEKRTFTPNDEATKKRQAEWLAKNVWNTPKGKKSKASAKAKDTAGHGAAKQTEAAPESHGLSLQWHGDALPAPQRWLVRNRLPETGAGLLVGQWGMLKTFFALDLSAHVMMGWDWTGEPVYRKAGVLCLAQEGSGSIPMRLAALVEQKIEPHEGKVKLPFAWASSCPMLLGVDKDAPMPMLLATAKEAHKRFMKDFGLPLGLIWIDTLSSAGGWSDENDNAEAAQLMNVLRTLSDRSGAVVVGVDHLGKNVEAGSRGASSKEANSDFVLALLGTKTLAGGITDMRLALRKMREGPSGLEIPVAPKSVDMGVDEHGYPLTSVVLNWDVKRETTARKSNAHRVLEHALAVALREHGVTVKTARGPEVRAVDRDRVLAAYKAAYKPDEKLSDGAKRERFRKALAGAGSKGRVASEIIGGVEHLWFVEEPPL